MLSVPGIRVLKRLMVLTGIEPEIAGNLLPSGQQHDATTLPDQSYNIIVALSVPDGQGRNGCEIEKEEGYQSLDRVSFIMSDLLFAFSATFISMFSLFLMSNGTPIFTNVRRESPVSLLIIDSKLCSSGESSIVTFVGLSLGIVSNLSTIATSINIITSFYVVSHIINLLLFTYKVNSFTLLFLSYSKTTKKSNIYKDSGINYVWSLIL